MAYDRSLIVADPRRCEPKKFGGRRLKWWSLSTKHAAIRILMRSFVMRILVQVVQPARASRSPTDEPVITGDTFLRLTWKSA